MRKIISLICILLPILAHADELTIRDNAPDRYTVVKGDTLWEISGKFFKDPWKWPEIWGLNKNDIKDPHWIYPGDVIVLDRNAKRLHVGELPVEPQAAPATEQAATSTEKPLVSAVPPDDNLPDEISTSGKGIVKLKPKMRIIDKSDAISSIPTKLIAPFLSRPLVIESDYINTAPVLVGSVENHNLLGEGDTVFAINMPLDKGLSWQIYRPGKALVDPDTDDTLGYEAIYLGDANVEKFAEISTIKISKSVLDIQKGDNLIQSEANLPPNIVPRSPPSDIKAKVISIFGGMDQAGQNAIIVINKGKTDGLSIGHVLALYKESDISKFQGESYKLPALRYGLIFVFRTFERVSYALVMEVKRPVRVNDTAETP